MKPLLDQEHVYWTEEYYKPNILYPLRKGISVDLVNLGNVTLTGEHKDKMQEFTDLEWETMKTLAAERI